MHRQQARPEEKKNAVYGCFSPAPTPRTPHGTPPKAFLEKAWAVFFPPPPPGSATPQSKKILSGPQFEKVVCFFGWGLFVARAVPTQAHGCGSRFQFVGAQRDSDFFAAGKPATQGGDGGSVGEVDAGRGVGAGKKQPRNVAFFCSALCLFSKSGARTADTPQFFFWHHACCCRRV